MTTRKLWLFMATTAVLLTACGRDKSEPPVPTLSSTGAASAPFTTPAVDPSMPVAPPLVQNQAIAPQNAASGVRTPAAQEAGPPWVPMPGQNNDHSAPTRPASAASAR